MCMISSEVSTAIHDSIEETVQKRSKRYTVLYPWLPYNTAIAVRITFGAVKI